MFMRLFAVTVAVSFTVTGCGATSGGDDPSSVNLKPAVTSMPKGTPDPGVVKSPGVKPEKPKPTEKGPRKVRPAEPELAVLTAGVWASTITGGDVPPAEFKVAGEGAQLPCATMGVGADAYPTYCPDPATVFWPDTWDEGAFTTLLVAGREQAQHIMAVTGTTPDDPAMAGRVADCYAGAWLEAARDEGLLVPAEGDDLDGAIRGVFEQFAGDSLQRAVDAHAGVDGGVDACQTLPPVIE